MTKSDMKADIAATVLECQGCKATELVVKLPEWTRKGMYDSPFDFVELIEEMVDEGTLVEVEYVLPNMQYRIKSFLLPAGTSIRTSLIK